MNLFGCYTVPFSDGSYRTYRIFPDERGRVVVIRGVGKNKEYLGYVWLDAKEKMRFTLRRGVDQNYTTRYYTYVYSRDSGPFYVGKGSNGRVDDDHEGRKPEDSNQIRVEYWPSEAAAFENEKRLILEYGRLDLGTGTLENLTAGGGSLSRRPPKATVTNDIKAIFGDPERAALSYAVHSAKCSRCERPLTVPASISKGVGPECAQKAGWTKLDNARAFADLMETAGPSALNTYLDDLKPKPKPAPEPFRPIYGPENNPPAVTCKKEEVPSRGIPHRMFVVKDVAAVSALYQADFNGVVQWLVDFEGGAQ